MRNREMIVEDYREYYEAMEEARMERKVYAYITTDGHGNKVAEVDGKKYWETVDVASRLDYGESYEVGDFYGDGWVLADTLDSLYVS